MAAVRSLGMRFRLTAALILAVLTGNAAVLATTSAPAEPVAAPTATAPAPPVTEPSTAPVPALDPLTGIEITVPQPLHVDPDAPLPVPEPPPANPYAPTPEVRLGTLSIPKIGLEQPLFEGVTLTSINRGPSHWPGTALPGQLGNVVVAGHRTTYSKPFWSLNELVPGDELVFRTDGGEFVYELVELEVVAPDAIHIVNQRPAHEATLFACHPRGSARQRIVAQFRLVPPTRTVTVPVGSVTPT